MTKAEKERVQTLVNKHKFTEEEALDIVQSDKEIDQGKRVYFDLSIEEEKLAKKFANTGTRKAPTAYKFDKRQTRKENPTKGAIISEIAKFLEENSENACENVEITNKERQIKFCISNESYELTLVQKRKPKS